MRSIRVDLVWTDPELHVKGSEFTSSALCRVEFISMPYICYVVIDYLNNLLLIVIGLLYVFDYCE